MEVAFLQCLLHLRLYSLLTCGLGLDNSETTVLRYSNS